MSLQYHELGFEVPGPYREPPAGAPVAALEGYVDNGYVVGPPAPLLTDYRPKDPDVPALQDALMIMAGTVSRRRSAAAAAAAPRLICLAAASRPLRGCFWCMLCFAAAKRPRLIRFAARRGRRR